MYTRTQLAPFLFDACSHCQIVSPPVTRYGDLRSAVDTNDDNVCFLQDIQKRKPIALTSHKRF